MVIIKLKPLIVKTPMVNLKEIVVDRITNMDNTLLIIDEAHNIVGNQYGEALKKLLKFPKISKYYF